MLTLSQPWRTQHKVPPRCTEYTKQWKRHATFNYDQADALSTKVEGFGGAFTEAAAKNFYTLSKDGQERALELLFGGTGLGYNLGRTHINSCDFSVESYDFDGVDGDFELEGFGGVQERDGREMMPFIQRARSRLAAGWGEDLRLVASPWSPPAWMKGPTEGEREEGREHAKDMLGSKQGTCIRDGVGRDSKYADAWARYMSKWVSSYEKSGIPIWAITVQNEPEFAAPWEACSFNTSTQLAFVSNFLGPTFRKDHSTVKILGFDHNKDHAVHWARELGDAGGNLDGIGYHWYAGGMDRLLDGGVGGPNMHRLREETTGLVLGTEGCHCPSTGYAGGELEVAWKRAERNAHAILADLGAGSAGSIEWNLILDKLGGPNHLGNVCDGPIVAVPDRATVDPAKGKLPGFEKGGEGKVIVGDGLTVDELVRHGGVKKDVEVGVLTQPMYWVAGHFTRFLREGSRATRGIVEGKREPVSGKFSIEEDSKEILESGGDRCLGLKELAGEGHAIGIRGGSQLVLQECAGGSTSEMIYDKKRGEIREENLGVCLTTGWPFLQGGSFVNKDGDTVLVILNEAEAEAGVAIQNGNMLLNMDGHSIATVVVAK
ncbi:hypothetical protein TrRE_jg2400 [Triparma retinervis]|uniref:Glucosylceramidase n=1 Tax=Triparma retinervis TaxID=2557542 RepID=A0A9W6Z688_9STRA|nr:hypothetical protein TrRE_jg2400 [Triparma retinervis]